jgi:hypothetical protein
LDIGSDIVTIDIEKKFSMRLASISSNLVVLLEGCDAPSASEGPSFLNPWPCLLGLGWIPPIAERQVHVKLATMIQCEAEGKAG